MSQTVADGLVGTFEQFRVGHIFGLIGDSLNPLADAVRRSRVEWIGVRHEEGAAPAAFGQVKLAGALSARRHDRVGARLAAGKSWPPAFANRPPRRSLDNDTA
jgi:Thiamine pyrophosphate enzyme, N-terminal TPP binding domain